MTDVWLPSRTAAPAAGIEDDRRIRRKPDVAMITDIDDREPAPY
ncbi:hypothetical protein [Hamadaea tsunoensis]|nr:hypothetical protein [Hamadaea tsunoensis]